MKAVLVLCLLAFMSCQKDIMDIAKCLYGSPKVKEIIADVMVAIATKDFSKLWPKIQEALPELIPVVIKCVVEDDVNLEKVNLPFITNWKYGKPVNEVQDDKDNEDPDATFKRCLTDCKNHLRMDDDICKLYCNAIIYLKFDDIYALK